MRSSLRLNATAYMFMLPWLIGLFVFTLWPIVSSFYLSFTHFELLKPPEWIGLDNYKEILTDDPRFVKSLKVTFFYVIIAIPLKLIAALAIALLLNRNIKGIGLYRSLFYLPSLIGGSVAIAIMWMQIFGDRGVVNIFLALFGIKGPIWISNPDYAIYTLIILAAWQFGSSMVIFLAGLKQIPQHLYEASSIDGANRVQQFVKVTIPMLSPVVFFNLVMNVIGGFIVFTQGFIITKGGPMDATLFYAIYLYQKGFTYFQMGYASALAWILLLIIGIFTALLFQSSKVWVYYESGGEK